MGLGASCKHALLRPGTSTGNGLAEPGWHVARSQPRPAVTLSWRVVTTTIQASSHAQPVPPDFDRCERAQPPSAGPAHRLPPGPRCMHLPGIPAPPLFKPRRQSWAHSPKRPTPRDSPPHSGLGSHAIPCHAMPPTSTRAALLHAWLGGRLGATRAGTHQMTPAPPA